MAGGSRAVAGRADFKELRIGFEGVAVDVVRAWDALKDVLFDGQHSLLDDVILVLLLVKFVQRRVVLVRGEPARRRRHRRVNLDRDVVQILQLLLRYGLGVGHVPVLLVLLLLREAQVRVFLLRLHLAPVLLPLLLGVLGDLVQVALARSEKRVGLLLAKFAGGALLHLELLLLGVLDLDLDAGGLVGLAAVRLGVERDLRRRQDLRGQPLLAVLLHQVVVLAHRLVFQLLLRRVPAVARH